MKVDDINRLDRAELKAAKIAAAINRQIGPAFKATTPGDSILVQIRDTNKIRVTADPTKEGFDKLNPKIGYRASLGGFGSPTGEDPFGSSSIVRVGIEDVYIATIMPTLSMTAFDVFSLLEMDLDRHDIAATFDQTSSTLTLDNLVSADHDFVFGNTDTGLNTFAGVAGVPEPATFVLLSVGILCLLGYSWRNRKQAVKKAENRGWTRITNQSCALRVRA